MSTNSNRNTFVDHIENYYWNRQKVKIRGIHFYYSEQTKKLIQQHNSEIKDLKETIERLRDFFGRSPETVSKSSSKTLVTLLEPESYAIPTKEPEIYLAAPIAEYEPYAVPTTEPELFFVPITEAEPYAVPKAEPNNLLIEPQPKLSTEPQTNPKISTEPQSKLSPELLTEPIMDSISKLSPEIQPEPEMESEPKSKLCPEGPSEELDQEQEPNLPELKSRIQAGPKRTYDRTNNSSEWKKVTSKSKKNNEKKNKRIIKIEPDPPKIHRKQKQKYTISQEDHIRTKFEKIKIALILNDNQGIICGKMRDVTKVVTTVCGNLSHSDFIKVNQMSIDFYLDYMDKKYDLNLYLTPLKDE